MASAGRRRAERPATGRDSGASRVPDLVFESTAGFEADLARLPTPIRARVVAGINDRCGAILGDRPGFESALTRPFAPDLPDGLDSTLSVLAMGDGLRVILALDDDPLFGRVLVTLYRVVEPSGEAAAYRSTASRIDEGF